MKKVKFLILLILTILVLTSISYSQEIKPFTLLIYMNGSDLETDDGIASADLEEMMIIGSSSSLNIIVETGGTKDWQIRGIDDDRIQRWYITEDDMYLEKDLSNANMGEASTLESFIRWGIREYPAESYGLIMWNHGSGSVYGYGYDENYDGDTLLLSELQEALEAAYDVTGIKFELIGFDTCLMASVETASILSPYAEYLIASEEIEPSHGWDYLALLDYIENNPYDSGRRIGKNIISAYLDYSIYFGTEDAITLSVIDLDRINSVENALSSLSQEILKDIEGGKSINAIIKARSRSESYGEEGEGYGSADMVDLYDFADNLEDVYPTETNSLKNAIEDAIIYNLSGKLNTNASGMSVYFPLDDKDMFSTKIKIYRTVDFSRNYIELVDQVTSILLGEDEYIASETTKVSIGEFEDITNEYFEIHVDSEYMDNILETYLVIGELIDEEKLQIKELGVIPGIVFDRQKETLRGYYVEGWETIGNQFAVMNLLQEEEDISEYTIPVLYNGEPANIHVLYEDGQEGEIIGVRMVTQGNIPNKDFIRIKKGDKITPIYEVKSNTISKLSYGNTFSVGSNFKLGWQKLPQGEYTYQFYIRDVLGKETYSNYVVVPYGKVDDIVIGNSNNDYELTIELTIADPNVKLNSETIKLDVPAQIIDGRSMMPIRFVAESLGATVNWNSISKTVIIDSKQDKIYIPIGSSVAFLNGEAIELDVPAQIVDNRTLMPVRFVAESLGGTVDWNSETRTVLIYK